MLDFRFTRYFMFVNIFHYENKIFITIRKKRIWFLISSFLFFRSGLGLGNIKISVEYIICSTYNFVLFRLNNLK